jgi:hypothetical protein
MAQMTAGDLTPEHYGLEITYLPAPAIGDVTAPFRKTVVVDELRRWNYNGVDRVGVSDFTPNGGFMGTEYNLPASTEVTVGARVRKARKKPWSKSAINA